VSALNQRFWPESLSYGHFFISSHQFGWGGTAEPIDALRLLREAARDQVFGYSTTVRFLFLPWRISETSLVGWDKCWSD
jgi:hypothetical protein